MTLKELRERIRALRTATTQTDKERSVVAANLAQDIQLDGRIRALVLTSWPGAKDQLALLIHNSKHQSAYHRLYAALFGGGLHVDNVAAPKHDLHCHDNKWMDLRTTGHYPIELLPPQERWRAILSLVRFDEDGELLRAANNVWECLRVLDDPACMTFRPLLGLSPCVANDNPTMDGIIEAAVTRLILFMLSGLELWHLCSNDNPVLCTQLVAAMLALEKFLEQLNHTDNTLRIESRRLRLSTLTPTIVQTLPRHIRTQAPMFTTGTVPRGHYLKVYTPHKAEHKSLAVRLFVDNPTLGSTLVTKQLQAQFPRVRFPDTTIRWWLEFENYEWHYKYNRLSLNLSPKQVAELPKFMASRVRKQNTLTKWEANLRSPSMIGGLSVEDCLNHSQNETLRFPANPSPKKDWHRSNNHAGPLRAAPDPNLPKMTIGRPGRRAEMQAATNRSPSSPSLSTDFELMPPPAMPTTPGTPTPTTPKKKAGARQPITPTSVTPSKRRGGPKASPENDGVADSDGTEARDMSPKKRRSRR